MGRKTLEAALVPPPPDAPDVCPTCRSWLDDGRARCRNCEDNLAALGSVVPVVPVSLYRKPSELRDWLTYYKPNDEEHHPEYGDVVGKVLRLWLEANFEAFCRTYGAVDLACVVPSAHRKPPHPFSAVLDQHVRRLGSIRAEVLAPGSAELGWRRPAANGFVLAQDVQDRSALVVDDVYTTGARSQSAAHALASGGAAVRAILVVGRRVNPGWRPEVAALWERQLRLGFRFSAPPWWARG